MAYTALLDACVLYSAPLTDLLLRIALTDLYRAKWSTEIHDEWMQNLARNRPDLPWGRIERRRDQMDRHVRDALVDGYAALVPTLTLPDPNDRHVLAAAIVGRADVIVTFNLGDFPPDSLEPYGIETQHPDEFLSHLMDLDANHVCSVVRGLRGGLGNPPMNAATYVASLERHGLPNMAALLRDRLNLI
jgi:predicted nucleic acid-binding protein